jgi:hypothetical protein
MRSNAGMVNRQGDVDMRFDQVSAPGYHFGKAWRGLAWFVGDGKFLTCAIPAMMKMTIVIIIIIIINNA